MKKFIALASLSPFVLSLFALIAIADEPATPKSKAADGTVCILRGYVRDLEEEPIANATVRVAMPTRNMRFLAKDAPGGTIDAIKGFLVENRELTTKTDDRGSYSIKIPDLFGPIMASIDVAAPGYERLSGTLMMGGDDRTTRLIPKGIARENFTLNPAAYFRGVVVDQDGKPVKQVAVSANMTIGRGQGGIERSETNDQGEFEIFNYPVKVGDGQVGSVYFTHPSFLPSQISPIHAIEDDERGKIRVVLQAGQTISGTVHFASGKPAPDVMIKATGANGQGRKAVLSDQSGRFSLQGLPNGSLDLSVQDLTVDQKVAMQLKEDSDHDGIQLTMQKIDLPDAMPTQQVLGMTLTDGTPEIKEAFGLFNESGAVILKPGLSWVRLGIGKLQRGFYVLDGRPGSSL